MNPILRRVSMHRLSHAGAVLMLLTVGLSWLAARIPAPPIVPSGPTDQPIRRNLAKAPDRPAAHTPAGGRMSEG
jgi:hypothetical protein